MGTKSKALYGSVVGELDGGKEQAEVQPLRRKGSAFVERTNALAQLTSGDLVEKTHMWVEPDRCRMWPGHNRRYELLSEARCADLIEGFKVQGQQEFPAIVRALKGDPDYDYEVVCGARRHWTVSYLRANNYPKYKFLIEVRDITDEEAFRLSDVENRDREDISDYERAIDYQSARKLYYKNQKEMAERLEVGESWLSRFLDLAELPEDIVNAYWDVTHIRTQHSDDLKKIFKDRRNREKILKRARELREQQDQARKNNRRGLDGQQVIKALKDAARSTKQGRPVIEFASQVTGKKILTVTKKGRGGLVLNVLPGSGATKEEVIETCGRALTEMLT